MIQGSIVDKNGYFIKNAVYQTEEDISDNFIRSSPPNGLYRAKWTGTEWIEDMTQEEIDALNNQPSLPTQEERIDMLENMILMMMEV